MLLERQNEKKRLSMHCDAKNQLADIFIKELQKSRFETIREKLKVCNSSYINE